MDMLKGLTELKTTSYEVVQTMCTSNRGNENKYFNIH